MATSFTPVQLDRFRREAKKLCRQLGLSHSGALDQIARQNGYDNWSLLSKHSGKKPTIPVAVSAVPSRPANSFRHYLHGDVAEGDPGSCYCARCDVFCPLDHLVPVSCHADNQDGERFLSNLEGWNRLSPEEHGRRFRPNGAPNILEASARSARASREAARSPFHRWLERQRGRNDVVGDLAQEVLRDDEFPVAASTQRAVAAYLEMYGTHVLDAVREAWREFEGTSVRPRTVAGALAAEFSLTMDEAEQLADAEYTELTGHSGDGLYGYEFDFSEVAAQALATKLTERYGSLILTVGPGFFDGIKDNNFSR